MASLFWSWIFILFFQPGYAQVSYNYEVLAKRALESVVFDKELSKVEKSRNTYIALVVTGGVVFIALVTGLIFLIMRDRKRVKDPESVPTEQVDKPRWFMVNNEKSNWWNNFQWQSSPTDDGEHPEGSRIERIRAALNKSKQRKPLLPIASVSKAQPSARDTIALPMQSVPQIQSSDLLERGSKAPIYPVAQVSSPQVPTLTRTMYEGDKPEPRSPPKAIVTSGLSRSIMRSDRRGFPRSPAGRRKSWLTRGSQLRHPFLPLKDSDVPTASVPKTASKPSYMVPVISPVVESKFVLPPLPKRAPPPLNLGPDSPRREVRPGLPTSPRPRVRIQSPAF
jgi:hypothetical protein